MEISVKYLNGFPFVKSVYTKYVKTTSMEEIEVVFILSRCHNEQYESYNHYIVKIIIHIDLLSAIFEKMDL